MNQTQFSQPQLVLALVPASHPHQPGLSPHQRGPLAIYPVKILAGSNHAVNVRDHLLLRSCPHLIDFLLGDSCRGVKDYPTASGLDPKQTGKTWLLLPEVCQSPSAKIIVPGMLNTNTMCSSQDKGYSFLAPRRLLIGTTHFLLAVLPARLGHLPAHLLLPQLLLCLILWVLSYVTSPTIAHWPPFLTRVCSLPFSCIPLCFQHQMQQLRHFCCCCKNI